MDRRMTAIWILLFSLYFLNTRFCLDGYELEYVLSSMNVYHGNGPSLTQGFTKCPGIWSTDSDHIVYPRQNFLQTYLSVPFYALGAVLFGEKPTLEGKGGYWDLPWGPVACVSMLNAMLAALLAVLVGLIAKDLGTRAPGHYIIAVLFGITTMNWHYGGLGMEVVQTTVMTAAIWSAIRFRITGKILWLSVSSGLILLLPNCKKISIIFVLPIIAYLVWSIFQHDVKAAWSAAIIVGSAMVTGAVVMAWSMSSRFHADPDLFPHLLNVFLSGGANPIDLIFGLTISPGEGLLIFNPMICFTLTAWPDFYRASRPEALLFIGVTILLLIMLLMIPYVLLDEEWGPRYLFPLLPLIYIAGSKGLLAVRTGAMRKLFITILIISIALQWLSSMYLGFKVLDVPLKMGISDYTLSVFTPSLSQIWLASVCLVSHLHHLIYGESLLVQHKEYTNYIGLGGNYNLRWMDLDTFDFPAGGLFTVRWVLSEKGIHTMTPGITLFLKLVLDSIILGMLGLLVIPYSRLKTISVSGVGSV